MEWTQHFSKPVLKKGYDYYKSDRVKIKKTSDKFIEATVIGYQEYNLRINFENDNIKSMYCSCPFEGNCKHLASTLYYADNHSEIFKKDLDIYNIIDKMSSKELKEFIIPELLDNPELMNRFKLFVDEDIDEEFYIDKLKNSYDNSTEVYTFIDEDMQSLINAKRFDLVFRLCDILILILKEYDYEHWWDAYDNLYEKLEKLMFQLIDSDSRNQAKEFLAKVIIDTEDEGLCDAFSYVYSQYWDEEELFN